ncbi:MAG TPA: MCE family protein [Candidatus Limnocylindrales bacterium]|nr:MCE family protein [Candidatus Limnocylindrales bacterium]
MNTLGRRDLGHRVLGAGFALLLLGLLGLSVAVYRKSFTKVDRVTLHADHAGMQLSEGADVKLRGVVVGEVRSIRADGTKAILELALDPSQRARIPADVTARLLPKTLFGERYVALQSNGTVKESIKDGAVIEQDRTETAIELERVLDNALPLLQAIKPDKLAAVLGALAYGLEGRGERLGHDVESLNLYLDELNRSMPTIAEDVRRLADVLQVYYEAAPDLLALLRDVTTTMTTIAQQRTQLADFLSHTTGLAVQGHDFLDRYDDRLIQVGRVTRPVLELLAAYAPEYPCLLNGIVTLQPRAEQVFATGRMHITLEATKDGGKYEANRDEPVYGAKNGPNCRGLPNPKVPAPSVPVNDGYDYGGERNLLRPIISAATGTPPDQVGDLPLLLWGPLLRGTVVNVQ